MFIKSLHRPTNIDVATFLVTASVAAYIFSIFGLYYAGSGWWHSVGYVTYFGFIPLLLFYAALYYGAQSLTHLNRQRIDKLKGRCHLYAMSMVFIFMTSVFFVSM